MWLQVRENAVERSGQESHFFPGKTLQSRELRFLDDLPNERQVRPGLQRDHERSCPAIAGARVPLDPLLRLQPVENAPERGGIDHRQFRELLLGDAFVLRQHDQRPALCQVQLEAPRVLLKASCVEAASVEQAEPYTSNRFHVGGDVEPLGVCRRGAAWLVAHQKRKLEPVTRTTTLPICRPDSRYLRAATMSSISNVRSMTGRMPSASMVPLSRSSISTDPPTIPCRRRVFDRIGKASKVPAPPLRVPMTLIVPPTAVDLID